MTTRKQSSESCGTAKYQKLANPARECRTTTINSRYADILSTGRLQLNGTHTINYSHDRDMLWRMDPLPTHPNGMRFSVFDNEGTLMATNEYYSVGGGFVVNEQTQGTSSPVSAAFLRLTRSASHPVDENLYYRGIDKQTVDTTRRDQTHGLPVDTLASAGAPALPAASDASTASTSEASAASALAETKPIPYLFRDAAGLLRLTQKHNVRSS